MKKAAKAPPPRTVAEYLRRVPAPERRALQALRRTIRSAAPGAEERISYGIPSFYAGGRMLVAYAVAARHCAFHPGALPVRTHAAALAGYSTSKGTVRFDPEKPLPAALVRRLVATRLAERMPRRVEQHGGKRP
ncbi:MAG TPA: DUF1801 domain-containing protein [Thermoanaerobaculia bacterium]|nr:DUF1801 domain-containing protein [Thermoanaerobaculia bacterium]